MNARCVTCGGVAEGQVINHRPGCTDRIPCLSPPGNVLCPHCGALKTGDECSDDACPLGHREYPPVTPDAQIPCLVQPGYDMGTRRAEMLARVAEIVHKARINAKGSVPSITDSNWLDAEGWAQCASLLTLAEAWLVEHWPEHDPDALKQASEAIAEAADWAAVAGRPSHDTLAFRRSEPLYQRKCETFGCPVVFRFDEPPPRDVLFNCDRHGGWIELPAGLLNEQWARESDSM
jgi:hypothetical protein